MSIIEGGICGNVTGEAGQNGESGLASIELSSVGAAIVAFASASASLASWLDLAGDGNAVAKLRKIKTPCLDLFSS